MKINCAYCGKEFDCYGSRAKRVKDVCCSVKCANKLKIEKHRNCACSYCGKLFHKKPSSITHYNYCSKECMALHRKEIYKGKANPNSYCRIEYGSKKKHCGYYWLYMPDHPCSTKDGYIREHRYIAEKSIASKDQLVIKDGRYVLDPNLDVHHIDGNKLNNSIDNLQIVTRSEHANIHGKQKQNRVTKVCKNCGRSFKIINCRKDMAKFCSKKCMDEFSKRDIVKKICPVCEKEFSCGKNENRTCCSVVCSNILNKRGATIVNCTNCGKEFKIKNSRLEKSKNIFCCRNCYTEYRRRNK